MKYYLKNKDSEVLLTAKEKPQFLKYSSDYNGFNLVIKNDKKTIDFGKVKAINLNYENSVIKYIESFPDDFERGQFAIWLIEVFKELKVRFEDSSPEYDYYSLEKKYKLNNENFDITIAVYGKKKSYKIVLSCISDNFNIKKEYSVKEFIETFKKDKIEQDLIIVDILEKNALISKIYD